MNKYENSYKKSCNVKKIRFNGKTYRVNKDALIKFLTKSVAVIALVGTAVVVTDKAINNYNEFQYLQDTKRPYVQILRDNTQRNNSEDVYWYNYDKIARDILNNSEDLKEFDLFIYSTYGEIGYNKESKIYCMDELFNAINTEISKDAEKYSDFEIYKNFEDYLKTNNFVDNKGNVDFDSYKEIMNNKLKNLEKEESASWRK